MGLDCIKRRGEIEEHARCGALNFNGNVQSYDARSSKHFDYYLTSSSNLI